MLYNLDQLLTQSAQLAGIKDENGEYGFDATTFPTSGLATNMLNDAIRELTSQYDYTFLETSKSYPFLHIISGVQSLYLSGTSGGTPISGVQTPYPSDVLNYSWTANNSVALTSTSYSGVTFTGVSSSGVYYTGTSTYGEITTGPWTGTGYTYQLDADIDKILAPGIYIPNSTSQQTAQGVICQWISNEDLIRLIPIGVINASGTPSMYTEFPGMSPAPLQNKVVQFFPFPQASYSGQTFIVPYKKKHVDLVNDTDYQNVIPEQWQYVIQWAFLEKVFDLIDNPKAELATQRKNELINQMRIWDANSPAQMRWWRDYNYNSSVSSAYDSSTWLHLSDGPGR